MDRTEYFFFGENIPKDENGSTWKYNPNVKPNPLKDIPLLKPGGELEGHLE